MAWFAVSARRPCYAAHTQQASERLVDSPTIRVRSPLSLQSTKHRQLLLGRTDHPRFRSCLFGTCELCLRFGSFSQTEQSFDQRCLNPIFLLSSFSLAFALYAFCEQLPTNS